MFGIKTRVTNNDFVTAARAHGLLTIPAGDNVVRLLPPLIVDEADIAEGVRRLDEACVRLERDAAQKAATQ